MAKLSFTAGDFAVTAPPAVHFAFNPWIFDFERVPSEIMMEVSALSFGGDLRELRDGKVRFDLSRWVRTLFDGVVAERLAALDYTALLPGDSPAALSFTTPTATALGSLGAETALDGDYRSERVALWGGAERGEACGGDETLRWWFNYPFTVDMCCAPGDTNTAQFFSESEFLLVLGTGGQLLCPLRLWLQRRSVEDIGSYASIPLNIYSQARLLNQDLTAVSRTVTLVPDCAAVGERGKSYLRWIDSMGRLRYWLFTELSLTEQVSAEQWNMAERPEPEVYGGAVNDAQFRRQTLTSVRTRTLAAASLSEDEFALVGSVARSPVIDEFDGYGEDGNALWHRVGVVAGSFQRDRSRLQDFQFSITDRTQTTQSL